MSISDIAHKVGVSPATVSRYLNKSGYVAREKAKLIQQVIDEMGYRPRIRRPGPKTPDRVGIRTGAILMLSLPGYEPTRMSLNPGYARLVSGMKECLYSQGLTLISGQCSENHPYPEQLDRRFCDGVIIFGKGRISKGLQQRLHNIPAVRCLSDVAEEQILLDVHHYDNTQIGRIAGEYLNAKGHRKVAYFSADSQSAIFSERERGLQEFCSSVGIELFVYRTRLSSSTSPPEVYRNLASSFIQETQRPTAAFFCTDEVLLGVNLELAKLGFATETLESVGCGNDDVYLRYFNPRPGSIDTRLDEVGEQSVRTLLKRMAGAQDDVYHHLLVPRLVTELPHSL